MPAGCEVEEAGMAKAYGVQNRGKFVSWPKVHCTTLIHKFMIYPSPFTVYYLPFIHGFCPAGH